VTSASWPTKILDLEPLPSGTLSNLNELDLDSTLFLDAATSSSKRLRFALAVPLIILHFFHRPTVAVMYSYGTRRSSESLNRDAKSMVWTQTQFL
jgi:hypothetical protein